MAELIIHIDKIKHNIKTLSRYFEQRGTKWSLVTKVFSGEKEFLRQLLTDDVIADISSVGDSRLTSLRNLRAVNPEMKTIYIKPPAQIHAGEVVRYADISLNSSLATIEALNDAARKAGKIHQIIIMIEMGELREGVNHDSLLDLCGAAFALDHIEVAGIGSNLGCMYGVEPTEEKLRELLDCKTRIEKKFGRSLRLVSGGTSITLPLIERGHVPGGINHFRIGEAAFFGVSPLNNLPFQNLQAGVFEFRAHIIELEYKNLIPDGNIGDANIGHAKAIDQRHEGSSSFKAILDFGILDVDKRDIEFAEPGLSFVGMTSDMLVIDIGDNLDADGNPRYAVGDTIEFLPNYMAVARLLNSKFIDKIYLEESVSPSRTLPSPVAAR